MDVISFKSAKEINQRLNQVDFFVQDHDSHEAVKDKLGIDRRLRKNVF